MAHTSAIEWTEATWNPWHGCHKVSQGCKNCYMFRDKARYGQDPNIVTRSKTKFYDPLKWSEPRTIFTCSWSDFFIEEADAWRDEAFAIMALTPQHTYQVLTKRPDRMWNYLYSFRKTPGRIAEAAIRLRKERNILFPNAEFQTEPLGYGDPGSEWYPLKNVHLGVSVEDQKTADERIPLLLQTPAALRWLSIEPLLGPVDLTEIEVPVEHDQLRRPWDIEGYKFSSLSLHNEDHFHQPPAKIDWVVAGGESGPAARPTHPNWLRDLRNQCIVSGVPFFFKQWGEYVSVSEVAGAGEHYHFPDGATVRRVGKHNAGRTLDGRTWDEMPEVSR